MQFISRACGLLATLMPFALGAACSDPELASELNTEGPPEVVEVNVRTESAVLGPGDPTGLQAGESATFCRPGREYRVNTVYCPEARDEDNAPIPGERETEPVDDGDPTSWYVRVIFDELLDPDIEDLETDENGVVTGHIADTQPVVLSCNGVELDYDGYYDPSGNHLSFAPGPSLVVTPAAFVATGSDCEVTLADNVVDKDGDSVPNDQVGAYEFSVAVLSVYGSEPADESEGVALDSTVSVTFGAPINLTSAAGLIVVTDADDVEVAGELSLHTDEKGAVDDETTVVFTPAAPLAASTTYTLTVSDGIEDIEGGGLVQEAPFTASFTTGDE
jgi:hypothetical protein